VIVSSQYFIDLHLIPDADKSNHSLTSDPRLLLASQRNNNHLYGLQGRKSTCPNRYLSASPGNTHPLQDLSRRHILERTAIPLRSLLSSRAPNRHVYVYLRCRRNFDLCYVAPGSKSQQQEQSGKCFERIVIQKGRA